MESNIYALTIFRSGDANGENTTYFCFTNDSNMKFPGSRTLPGIKGYNGLNLEQFNDATRAIERYKGPERELIKILKKIITQPKVLAKAS